MVHFHVRIDAFQDNVGVDRARGAFPLQLQAQRLEKLAHFFLLRVAVALGLERQGLALGDFFHVRVLVRQDVGNVRWEGRRVGGEHPSKHGAVLFVGLRLHFQEPVAEIGEGVRGSTGARALDQEVGQRAQAAFDPFRRVAPAVAAAQSPSPSARGGGRRRRWLRR